MPRALANEIKSAVVVMVVVEEKRVRRILASRNSDFPEWRDAIGTVCDTSITEHEYLSASCVKGRVAGRRSE